MMSRRQMLMMLTEEQGLPDGFLQVEYLTSTSGAYFDLPKVSFDANDSIRTQIKFRYLGSKTNNFFVAGDGNKKGGVQYEYGYNNGWWWRSGNFANDTISDNITSETTKNSVIEVDWSHIYGSSTNNFVFRLFQRSGFSVETEDRSIYYLKFYKNNELLHNLIPCIRISDSKPGMYDLVGRQFYTNAGTGEFVVGWYVSDGLIFWLDGLDRGGVTGEWTDKVGNYTFTLNDITEETNGIEFAGTIDSYGGCDSDCFSSITSIDDLTTEFCVNEASGKSKTNAFILQSISERGPCAHMSNDRCVFTNASRVNRGTELIRSIPMTVSMNNSICLQNFVSKELVYVTLNAGHNTDQTTIGKREGTSGYYPFTGTVHSIRVYNRKLTAEEMLRNQKVDNYRYQLGLNI